jgi:hypothetical protein
MRSRKLQTCFISAPLQVDTEPLRAALATRGVTPRDASEVLAQSHARQTIESVIAGVDFVCVVIPEGPVDANVMLDLGVAMGTGRPRLLFVAPKAELPVALRGQPYARASLTDAEALRFHLDAFLKNAGKGNGVRDNGRPTEDRGPSPVPVSSALARLAEWEGQPTPPQESDLVPFLADVFETAGYTTSTAPTTTGQENTRADLAVWVDELQAAMGNPLIIEVAAHHAPIGPKGRQLQHLLQEFRSPLGLLVCWGQPDAHGLPDDWRRPIVVVMGVRELVEAIGRGDFARTLLTRRNNAFHSAA